MAINPVIFVHGIQGSWLKDQYPVDYDREILWTGILRKNFDALHLHELDNAVDADPRRWVMPHQAVPLIYEGLLEEIRDEMDEQPYAYMFTYDWRKDNRWAAQALAQFIDRVLRVCRAHEQKAGRLPSKQVVLIGHSMGGLVIKWCAVKIPSCRKKIAKMITIATPFKGSLKAVEALLPGARNLFGVENKKSMRHAARTLPGIYQLLPTWNEAIVNHNTGEDLDVFSESSWQENLVQNLGDRFSANFFPSMLADAKSFSNVVRTPWPEKLRQRVYYSYGEGSDTWKQVRVDTEKENFYLFDEVVKDDKGDGTVHRKSSRQEKIDRARAHVDHKHPFKDLLPGQHANMPNHSNVQDWILEILELSLHPSHSFESPN